jgi:hypothetical protein
MKTLGRYLGGAADSVGKLVDCNKICSVRITQHRGAFVQPFSTWKIKNYYIFWVCICSLRYLGCNARAPYCHLRPARLHEISPLYFINGTIIGKRVNEYNNCFRFLYNYCLKYSHSKKNWARHDQSCTLASMQNTRYSCPKLMKLEFSPKIVAKIFKYQIPLKSIQWEPSCSMRNDTHTQTDRHDEPNSRISQFCICA